MQGKSPRTFALLAVLMLGVLTACGPDDAAAGKAAPGSPSATSSSFTGTVMGTAKTPDPSKVQALASGQYRVTAAVCHKLYAGASAERKPAVLTSEGDFGTTEQLFDELQEGRTVTLIYHLRETPLVPFIDSYTLAPADKSMTCK